MITVDKKSRLKSLVVSDTYVILKEIVNDIIERSWRMRKTQDTSDMTMKVVSYGEGMEAGARELINLIDKYSK